MINVKMCPSRVLAPDDAREIAYLISGMHEHASTVDSRLFMIVPMITNIAKCWQGHGIPISDLVQDGIVAALEKLPLHQPAKGRFSTYVAPYCQAAIRAAVAREKRHGAGISLDAELNNEDNTLHESVAGTVDAARDAEVLELLADVMSQMTDREALITEMLMSGMSGEDVALQLGMTRENVRLIREKIANKIAPLISEEKRGLVVRQLRMF